MSTGAMHLIKPFSQSLDAIEPFPREILIVASEVTVSGRLLIDRPSKLQVPDDRARAKIESRADRLVKPFIRDPSRSHRVEIEGNGFCSPDRVGDLY